MQPSSWSQILVSILTGSVVVIVGGLVSILTGSVVVIVGGLVSAHLAIRSAMREFAWQRALERKERAYSSILEALAGLDYYLGEWETYLTRGMKKEIFEERREVLEDLARQSRKALHMAVAVGELSVSDDTVKAVRELIREVAAYYPDVTEAVNRHYDAVRSCIPRVIAEAKKDLARTRPVEAKR